MTISGLVPALLVCLIGALVAVAGFAFLGLTVAIPGMGLVLIGLLALGWVAALSRLSHLSTRSLSLSAVEGQPLGLELELITPRWLASGTLQIRHPLLSAPALPPGGRQRIRIEIRACGRGQVRLARPVLVLRDPTGLARVERHEREAAFEVLVLPRTETVHWNVTPRAPVTPGGAGWIAPGVSSLDLAGLRPYTPGTPVNRIHWPALARGGDLLERVLHSEGDGSPAVLIDPRCGRGPEQNAQLDRTIRAAASVLLELARLGGVDLFLPGRATPLHVGSGLAGWANAWRALAVLAPAELDAAPPVVNPRGGPMILACTDAARGRAAVALAGRAVLILAPQVPELGRTGSGSPVLCVAGCVAVPARAWA
jgi:uncharacterized protein (DUF58 family)